MTDELLELEFPTTRQMFANVFSLDLRSLAVFRIAIGITLIADLLFRFPTLKAMYSDDGFLTRAVANEYYTIHFGENWGWFNHSLHWISGSAEWQVAIFLLAAFFAGLLTIGCWTRIATIVSFVLLVSLHIRNPVILTSGDFMLKLSLFWGMFLPLGKTWSLDARRARTIENDVLNDVPKVALSFATAGFMVQLFCLYFFTGIAKWNQDWFSGDAMHYVLRLDIFITEFGRKLLEYPGLLKLTSWATLAAEVFLIWMIFYPTRNGWFRMLNLVVFWSFHIGIAFAMNIGLFPMICMVAWLPLIPTGVWDWVLRRNKDEGESVEKNLRPTRFDVARVGLAWPAQAFCALMLVYILCWNISNIESSLTDRMRTGKWRIAGYCLHVDQHFQMFGEPPKTNPWFVYEATLSDGSKVDVFRESEVDHERPEFVADSFPTFHWRRLHRNLVGEPYACLRQPMVDYLVRDWNSRHDNEKQIVSLKMTCYLEDTGPDYNRTDRRSIVWGEFNAPGATSKLLDQMGEEFPF